MQRPDPRETGEVKFWCRASGKSIFVDVDQNEAGKHKKEGDCDSTDGTDIHLDVHDPHEVLRKHSQSGERPQPRQCVKFIGSRTHERQRRGK